MAINRQQRKRQNQHTYTHAKDIHRQSVDEWKRMMRWSLLLRVSLLIKWNNEGARKMRWCASFTKLNRTKRFKTIYDYSKNATSKYHLSFSLALLFIMENKSIAWVCALHYTNNTITLYSFCLHGCCSTIHKINVYTQTHTHLFTRSDYSHKTCIQSVRPQWLWAKWNKHCLNRAKHINTMKSTK